MYIGDKQPYYDFFTHELYPGQGKPHHLTIDTPLSTFPLLIQGGHIFPARERVRRSSPLMWQDPFTLTVALSKTGTATGQLYLDDGVSFAHEKGEYVWRQFDFVPEGKGSVLRSSNRASGQSAPASSTDITPYDEDNAWAKNIAHVRVERIIVLGLQSAPSSVSVAGQPVQFDFSAGASANGRKGGESSRLVIKNPGVGVVEAWEIVIE